MANANLTTAKEAKKDEFYTDLADIQAEIHNYTIDKFQNKIILCNCDDPFESNFVKYFLMNFNRLGIKELIATGYKTSSIGGAEIGTANTPYVLRVKDTSKYLIGTQKDLDIRGAKYFLETEGNRVMTPLIGNKALDENGKQIQISVKENILDNNGEIILDKKGKPKTKVVKQDLYYEAGDFRSNISISLLQESDIVVTNPPFSLFREFVALLMKYNKQFLIIGNVNAITYKEIFPLISSNQLWLGPSISSGDRKFYVPDNYSLDASNCGIDKSGRRFIRVKGVRWFTNIDHAKRHQMLPLDLGFVYKGHEDYYPKYDNYDAINVDKTAEIPCDYEPCWYKCPHAKNCQYAQSEGKGETNALCENQCNGSMGVPITFIDKYCPEQFEILNANDLKNNDNIPVKKHGLIKDKDSSISINKNDMDESDDFSANSVANLDGDNAEISRTAEQQNSRTAEQQNSRTAEQQNSRTVYARIVIRRKKV